MAKTNKKKNPAWYIAACFLGLFILVLFLGQTIRKYSDEIYQNIRENTTENVEALTANQVNMLDKTLSLLEVQAQALAVYLSSPDLVVTPDMLKTFSDMNDEYLHVVMFREDGTAVSSEETAEEISFDEEVYRQVFAGRYGVTDTFIGSMGYEEVRVYAPIRWDGNITGGVYIDLNAEVLRGSGKSSLYDSAGYSYILKQDGTILLAPASYSYAQIYHNVREVFQASNSSEEIVDTFMDALQKGKKGNVVLDFSGEKQIICFQPSKVQEGWYYVSVLPLELVENNGQAVIRLSSRMITLFIVVILIFIVFLCAVMFFLLRDKWKKDINDGRVYKAISENIDTAIFIMDRNTCYIRHAFENINSILGIPAEQIQGSYFSREWLAQTGIPDSVADMVRNVEAASQPDTGEMKYYNPVKECEVWLSVSVSPLNLKGRKEYMIAFTDITEEKQLMERLHDSMLEAQSASAAKSSFLANMSHDIRTPMNAITGMTDIAIRSIEDRERVLDCLEKISLSSHHLKGLINDILDMSKIESGKLSLNPGVTSLPEVLEGLLNIIQFQVDEKGQRLQVVAEQVKHETVLCDAVRLNQVLMNIAANAVKFTPEGGTIRFGVKETDAPQGVGYGRYIFSVRDSGIGMSKEFQKVMFDAFSREKGSQIEKTEGSGLGMSISKWIVDQMGGSIQVLSEPGQGSEFIVTVDFPVSAEEAYEPQQTYSSLEGCHILMAEDNELNREIGIELLKDSGALVDTVENGLQCLEQFEASPPGYYQIILMDIRMPVMDGYESTRKIRGCRHADAAAVPILAVTADAFSEDIQAAKDAGMNGHISKPLDRALVIAEIKRQLITK